jgi:ubiquinone/menaquinone biosynthesis C-methylase UbiE
VRSSENPSTLAFLGSEVLRKLFFFCSRRSSRASLGRFDVALRRRIGNDQRSECGVENGEAKGLDPEQHDLGSIGTAVKTSEIDTSGAEAYEVSLVPGLMAPWAEVTVSNAQIREGASVLDVACGTGVAARYAARRSGCGGRVVGVDTDQGMLEVARAVSMKEGLSIAYQHGSAAELPFKSESFDAVLCLQGLQYFPDRLRAMSELRRVLRTGAPLVIVTWTEIEHCKGHWALVSALEHRGIDAAAARKPFSLSGAIELQSLAQEAGFLHASTRSEQRLSCFQSAESFVEAMLRGAPSTRQALEKVPAEDWPSFLAEVEAALAQWHGSQGLEFPTMSNVLEARR